MLPQLKRRVFNFCSHPYLKTYCRHKIKARAFWQKEGYVKNYILYRIKSVPLVTRCATTFFRIYPSVVLQLKCVLSWPPAVELW